MVSCWYLWIADSSRRCSGAWSVDTSLGRRGISDVSFKAFLLYKYTRNKNSFWKVFSAGWEQKMCLCCRLLNVFTAFFGSSVETVLWLFIGLLQQLLVEIKENLLPWFTQDIIDGLCYNELEKAIRVKPNNMLVAVVCQEKPCSLQCSDNQYEWTYRFLQYKSSLLWTDFSISFVIS